MSETFETLLQRAQAGDAAGQHLLALEYARRGQMTRARRWLRSAAEAGYGDAQNELALMALHGVGEAANGATALRLFRHAAANGSAEAGYQLATLAYTRGLAGLEEGEAEKYLRQAVARDFPAALRVMGMLAISDPEQHEMGEALLLRSAFLGDPLSQHYVGAGLWRREQGSSNNNHQDRDTARTWLARAVAGGAYVSGRLLGDNPPQAGAPDRSLAPKLPSLEHWKWPQPEPCDKTALCESFEAYSVEGVLSQAECEYLINIASPLLRRSATIDPGTGQPTLNELRTSSSMNFDSATQDIVLEWIERRMAATAGQPVTHGEPLSILRYRHGEEYRPHYDYIPLDSAEAEREFATRGQRLVTIFTYLSDVEAGGGTDFPELDVRVPAIQGNAVMFRNCDDDGRPDSRSLHAGMPVEKGEKWLAVLWLRDRPWVD